MKLRRFEQKDSEAVQLLHSIAMDSVGANMGSGPWNEDLDDIEGSYLRGGGDFVVGELEGEIIAMGGFRSVEPLLAEIKRMRVHPAFQQRGYGQQTYDCLETLAEAQGYARLVLDTLSKQHAAIKFYTKNGFEEYGREAFRGETQLLFAKQLVPST